MTQPATQSNDEITSVRGLIAYLEGVANQNRQVAGNEGFAGSLNTMEVGQSDVDLVQQAMAQSQAAGDWWQMTADGVRQNNMPVAEAYSASPNAANKHANTNE